MKRILLGSVVFILAAAVLFAAGPWSSFGGARAVKEGVGPNPWAINLTSNADVPYSGLAFQQPNGKLLFSQITQLSADYNAVTGGCGGGSPRFSIGVDTGNGVVKNVFVYIGDAPDFDCPEAAGVWQNTGNLINSSDLRFDSTQVGGPFYGTFADAVSLVGDKPVVYVSLVVDGGWKLGNEVTLVDNVTVNNFVLSAKGFGK